MDKTVEPFANISAQDLLKNTPRLFGWARKEDTGVLRSMVKALDWPWRYMILSAGCLYLYKNSEEQNFNEAIPLTNYRYCDAPEKTKYSWAFKLIHTSDVKTLFFAVDTDFDLKKWRDAITDEKMRYCSDASPEDEADGYSMIDERPPPPPPPDRRVQSTRQRPPAPLPSPPQRPHSMSCPPPLTEFIQQSSSSATPLRRKTSDLPPTPNTKTKPATLPRPPAERPKPQRPLTMGRFPKDISQGYNSVVNQLASANLSSPNKDGSVSPHSAPPPKNTSGTPYNRKNIRRGAPDGQSFKEKDKEKVLPNSALRLDVDSKEEVSSLLKNKHGVYIVRKSQSAQSKMALSVWITDRVRHYVIFHNEDKGYALDPEGPRFDKMEEMIRHYYDYNLPKCEAKFTKPYK